MDGIVCSISLNVSSTIHHRRWHSSSILLLLCVTFNALGVTFDRSRVDHSSPVLLRKGLPLYSFGNMAYIVTYLVT